MRLYLIAGKASGVNLEVKSGVEPLGRKADAQHYLPAAPAVKLAPNCKGSSFPLGSASGTERGTLKCGQPSISIITSPGLQRKLERSLQRFCKIPAQHGMRQFTGSKLLTDWRRLERQGPHPTVGEALVALLGSYRPTKAGQPPTSKVLPRHGSPALLGA